MAVQKQPTAEQLAQLQQAKNSQFMSLSYEQVIKANAQNGNAFAEGGTLSFDAPIISGAYATKVTLRHNLTVNVTMGSGSASWNAMAPYNFVKNLTVSFGNKQLNVIPYLAKVFDQMEGYNRTTQDGSLQAKTTISNMLHSVPSSLVNGANSVKFDTTFDLNALHPASINGLVPIFSSGTRMQISAQMPTVAGVHPIDNVISLGGGATATVTGTVDVIISYRDYQSQAVTQPLSPDLTGLPTVQIIELPTISPLTAGVVNHASVRNPYPFAKLIHVVADGSSSSKLCSADNISFYSLDKAENSSSSFFKYDNMVDYYKQVRERWGTDFDEGVLIGLDATTQNVANVSGKMGNAYLNLTSSGYPATRFGVNVNSVGALYTPVVRSFGVILNSEGIKTV
jgi:hypothetical protein